MIVPQAEPYLTNLQKIIHKLSECMGMKRSNSKNEQKYRKESSGQVNNFDLNTYRGKKD